MANKKRNAFKRLMNATLTPGVAIRIRTNCRNAIAGTEKNRKLDKVCMGNRFRVMHSLPVRK